MAEYLDIKPLEISGASLLSLGNEIIGPFPEYLLLEGKDSKKLVKEASKGLMSKKYEFDEMTLQED